MTDYPIFAQQRVTIDSEEIGIFGFDNSSFTYNGNPIMPRVSGITLQPVGAAPNTAGATYVDPNFTLQPADATRPGVVTAIAQTFGGDKTISGNIAATNLSGTNTGDVTLAAVGAVPNANGASLSGQILNLQPADATNPGAVTSGSQSFGGSKTFQGGVTLNDTLNFPATGSSTQTVMYKGGNTLFSCFGTRNNFFGDNSGNFVVTGTDNVGFGPSTCNALTTGQHNVACGSLSMDLSTTANDCTAIGYNSLTAQTTGFLNTAVGVSTLSQLTTGTNNSVFGGNAGSNYTGAETSNLLLANEGTVGESNTIRIGNAIHTAAYLAGTHGATSAGASAMVINADGLMGTIVSSKKRKREIQNIPDVDLERFYKFSPKKFKMNGDLTDEQHWGLIAEDVDEIMPEIIVYDEKKEPITVQYQKLDGLFLKAILSQKSEIESLKSVVQCLLSK